MEQLLFLGYEMFKAIVKLEIPSIEKKVALRELQIMNLHGSGLFPDLDSYALSLKFRYNNMKAPDEVQKEIKQKHNDHEYPFIP